MFNIHFVRYNVLHFIIQYVRYRIQEGWEIFLDNLNSVIAANLKKIRDQRKLSLDKVAELTGISKSMLGQIERGESNPTVTTVWKIVNGLKIQFTSLITNPKPDTAVISKNDIEPVTEDSGRYRLYPFFPYEEDRRFEVYILEIEKGGYMDSEAHEDGTQEFITVFDGQLTIRVNNQEYTVNKGDSIRFRADKEHIYHNSGDTLAVINMIVYYPLKL